MSQVIRNLVTTNGGAPPLGLRHSGAGTVEAPLSNLDSWLSGAEQVLSATRRMRLDEIMEAAVATTASALRRRLPFLVCGNGGSAADAQHIVGELIGSQHGLGRSIEYAGSTYNIALIWSGIFTLSLLSIVLYIITSWLESTLLRRFFHTQARR